MPNESKSDETVITVGILPKLVTKNGIVQPKKFFAVGRHNEINGWCVIEKECDAERFFVCVDADIQIVSRGQMDCVEPFLLF